MMLKALDEIEARLKKGDREFQLNAHTDITRLCKVVRKLRTEKRFDK